MSRALLLTVTAVALAGGGCGRSGAHQAQNQAPPPSQHRSSDATPVEPRAPAAAPEVAPAEAPTAGPATTTATPPATTPAGPATTTATPPATTAAATTAAATTPASPPATTPASTTASPAARPSCTHAAVTRVRHHASQLAAAHQQAQAYELLRRFNDACVLDPGQVGGAPNMDFFWLASDLSLAAYHAGEYVACLRVLAPMTNPGPPVSLATFDLEDARVGRAMVHNQSLCRKAHDRAMAGFAHPPCRFAHHGLDAVALPTAAGGPPTCVVLTRPAERDRFDQALADGHTDDPTLCPHVERVTRSPGRGATRTTPIADGGPLTSTSVCCNIRRVSLARRAGRLEVRVQGDGLDCFGGTARGQLDAVYQLAGQNLRLEHDDSVASH